MAVFGSASDGQFFNFLAGIVVSYSFPFLKSRLQASIRQQKSPIMTGVMPSLCCDP